MNSQSGHWKDKSQFVTGKKDVSCLGRCPRILNYGSIWIDTPKHLNDMLNDMWPILYTFRCTSTTFYSPFSLMKYFRFFLKKYIFPIRFCGNLWRSLWTYKELSLLSMLWEKPIQSDWCDRGVKNTFFFREGGGIWNVDRLWFGWDEWPWWCHIVFTTVLIKTWHLRELEHIHLKTQVNNTAKSAKTVPPQQNVLRNKTVLCVFLNALHTHSGKPEWRGENYELTVAIWTILWEIPPCECCLKSRCGIWYSNMKASGCEGLLK